MLTTFLATSFELNYAFWWYIPIIAVLIGGTIAILSGPQKTDGKSLGVLGMTSSGKTSFLTNLGLIDDFSLVTSVESYAARTIKIADREITIQQGEDIGGNESFIIEYYKKWITEKDIIVFIFDGEMYLTDEEYRDKTQSRLSFIYNQFMIKNAEKTDEDRINALKNAVIIASHSDQHKEGQEHMRKAIISSIEEKDYKDLFNTNLFGADLRIIQEVQNIANKIF